MLINSLRAIPVFWFGPGKDALDGWESSNDNSVSLNVLPCFVTSKYNTPDSFEAGMAEKLPIL